MSGGGASNYTPPQTSTPWIYKTDIAGGSVDGTTSGAPESATNWYNNYGRNLGLSPTGSTIGGTPSSKDLQSFADGGMAMVNPMSSYASPGFMTYQGQGQPNQPQQLASTQFNGGPDSGADYASANMGFDNSGSDGGVGGQPAPMQTPLGSPPSGMASGLPSQQGNKPLGIAQFQQPQGLQIQGNPTSQVVQRPQQR